MMDSVRVCNVALAHLGDRRITRLDEEAQEMDATVRYCADFFDIALGELLEANRWTFAKKEVLLVRTTAPIVGYAFAHQLPTDMVRLMTLMPGVLNTEDSKVYFTDRKVNKFRILGPQVQSNEQYLALRYIFQNEDPATWSKGFVSAFTRLLASFLAGPIADSPQVAQAHRAHYERVDLPNAVYLDQVQDQSGENNDNEIRKAESGLVDAGRSEHFPSDTFDEAAPGGGSTGIIIGDGSVIG